MGGASDSMEPSRSRPRGCLLSWDTVVLTAVGTVCRGTELAVHDLSVGHARVRPIAPRA
jgi:hypothetical protein